MLGALTTFAEPKAASQVLAEHERTEMPLVVDSGAWSVFTGTKVIDVDEHTRFVLANQDRYPEARFIALDVIGDADSSYANWRRQREAGARVEPTIHYGTDPRLVDRFLDDRGPGLATTFLNMGGMVLLNRRPSEARRVAAWCAAVRRRCPSDITVHGLSCTQPKINAVFPFEAVDSSYWLSPVRQFRSLPVFDARTGSWVILRSSQKHADGRVLTHQLAGRHGSLLRDVYDFDPSGILTASNSDFLRVTVASHFHMSRYFEARHGHRMVVHLAGMHPGPLWEYAADLNRSNDE